MHPHDPHGIRCPDDEGRAYRDGVYRPLDEAQLPEAPRSPDFPDPGSGPPFRRYDDVPRVPRLRHLVGPSVIALGMGLGAGEFLLWPNLITVNGYEIWWLFWIGVLTQFVVILEIVRWTVATGESVFAGMARLGGRGLWPWFFLAATLLSFFWPGWASESAQFTGRIVGVLTGRTIPWQPVALLMLLVIYLSLAVSGIVYNALERFEVGLVLVFFPMLAVVLLVVGILPEDVLALAAGATSIGAAPDELLRGTQFPILLIAVAYAGSGGTLLLAQSLWLRDKGFGMAAYQGRIAGLRGANEPVSESGYVFSASDPTALARFRAWMRVTRSELLVTFVLLIILSVVITSLVVTATLGTGNADLAGNLAEMVTREAAVLSRIGGRWLEIAFLTGGALVLFSTQVAIMDTVTRICGTVFYERYGRHTRFWTLKRTFLIMLTVLAVASAGIIVASWRGGATLDRLQPDFLLLVAGPFTIASMFVFAIVVGAMNVRRLPSALRPGPVTRAALVWAAALWGWFTAEQVSRVVLGAAGADPAVVGSIVWHPVRIAAYACWIAAVVWFAWAMLSRRVRRGAAVVALAFAASAWSPRGAAAQAPGGFVVRESAAPCLRLRARPDLTAPQLDCIPPGTSVVALAVAPFWRQVQLGDGRAGWAAKKYLAPGDPPPAVAGDTARDDAWLEIHVVDVGQGDGIWIHTFDDNVPGNGRYEGRNVVIDGGPAGSTLADYIMEQAHEGAVIDALIVTHPHADHYRGAAAVLERFDVAAFYDSGYPSTRSGWLQFLALMNDEVADGAAIVRRIGRAQLEEPDWGSELDVRFVYAWPGSAAGLGSGSTRENNASVVLRIEYGTQSILFMGDAEGKDRGDPPDSAQYVERWLLDSLGAATLRSTVLKIAHHGSETSSTLPFIEAVDPEFVIVSSGRQSFSGTFIPDRTTLARYCAHDPAIRIYRTDQDDEAEGRTASNDQDGDHVIIRTNGTLTTVQGLSGGRPITHTSC